MKAEQRLERMIQELKPGDHLCAIYQTPEQLCRIMIPFVKYGLEQKAKVVYIVDHSTAENILQMLRQAGLPAQEALDSGQLEIFSRNEVYLLGGYFDPDRMIDALKQLEADSLQAGWTGLWITGEMTWVLSRLPGTERVIEYEAKLNNFFPRSSSIAICQYWEEKFSPDLLLNVVRTHPFVISGDLVCQNPLYIPPEEFLASAERPSEESYRNFLHLIEERARNLDQLKESEERYRLLFENMLDGYAYCQIIYEDGRPKNFVYLDVNESFERLTGLKDVIGKRVTELIPGIFEKNPELFQAYSRVASSGRPEKFEVFLEPLNMWLSISVYSIEKGTFVAVFDNITERKLLEKTKEDFLFAISHELQTPVFVMNASLDLLQQASKAELDEQAAELVETCRRNLYRMQHLINNLLDSQRSSEVGFELNLQPTDLGDLIGRVIKDQELVALPKEMRIQLKTESLSPLLVDPDAFYRLAENLINNAVKFSPPGGVVSAEIHREGGTVVLSVQDQGPGILPEEQAELFRPFGRTNSSISAGFKGTGLGLYVAKIIAQAHGGEISLFSGPEKGLLVTVRLPLKLLEA